MEEVTLDLADSMRKIVRSCFSKAIRVIDRFHIQKLACDAVQEMRIKHRWEAIQEANDAMEEAKLPERHTSPYAMGMETPRRNYSPVAVICYSSQVRNGHKGSVSGRESSSMSSRT